MALQDQLRQAIEDSGLSLYRIAKDSGIAYQVLHRFASGRTRLDAGNRHQVGGLLRHETDPPETAQDWRVAK